MDANYFQHINYLNSFNEEQGTHLVNAGEIHYEPFGIYAGQKETLEDIEDGDTVAVPNDTTNEARALLLLEAQGWITLDPDAGITATPEDITDNPYNLEIEPFEAAQVARHIDEVSYVVLNGNYALEAGLNAGTDALAVESADSDAIQQYVNVIAVKEGNEDDEKIQALVEVLKSDEIKEFIESEYSGAVVPFEGEVEAAETEAEAVETEAE
jgi:D-methionine transport system substrate-binding protein